MWAKPGTECHDMWEQVRRVLAKIVRGFRIFDDPPDGTRDFFLVWIGFVGFLRGVFNGAVELATILEV